LLLGAVLLDPSTPNWAREILFSTGLSKNIYADSVSNNCISSLVALARAGDRIVNGKTHLAIVGGVESMSNPRLTFGEKANQFFLDLFRSKSFGQRLNVLKTFRPRYLFPAVPGVVEPSTGLSMGQHMELTAQEIGIPRDAQDSLALNSHKNGAEAQEKGWLEQDIFELCSIKQDSLIRRDTSIEKLSRLKPVFDRQNGTLTAGNSSALTDGACVLALASREKAGELGLPVLARVVDYEFAALDPKEGLLMAPGLAVPRLLNRRGLVLDDFDAIEIHEAFAAQVLANVWAWEKGWKEEAVGHLPWERTNKWGGSIALGHPLAATGARVALTLARRLQQEGGNLGLLSVCAAGGMGCAMVLSSE
jgi:acetyl-CoA acetyltransferase family protein